MPLPAMQVAIGPDQYEPNDVVTEAKQILSASPVLSLTFYTSNSGSPNDPDWYKFFVGSNSALMVSVQSFNNPLIARIYLSDGVTPVGTYVDTVGSTATSTAIVTNTTSNTQAYYVLISNLTNTNAYYTLIYNTTPIAMPTATSTPLGVGPDAYEPNDTIAEAAIATGPRSTPSFIAVGSRIDNLNFYPYDSRTSDAADWFEFYGRSGSIYQITTLNVQPGVETVMSVYYPVANTANYTVTNPPGLSLVSAIGGSSNPNNRYQIGVRGSQVMFQVPNGQDGMYWIEITNTDPSPRIAGQTYSLQVQEILQAGPTATITPFPPTLTPYPGAPDAFEPNYDFDHAGLIAPNTKYSNLNFVPWHPTSETDVNNDFFKLPVKQGVYYTCQTLDLSPGTDTNIIIYNQDRAGIGGNDDISPAERAKGNFASRFSWLSAYTGWAYILVGEVDPPLADEAGGRTYSLECDIGLPATATPLVNLTPVQAVTYMPPTPLPPEPTMTPYPTPRTAQNLPVRPITNQPTAPAAPPTATPRSVSVNVQVFNDLNRNGLLDPGEGIADVSVHLTDEQTGTPLAQGTTDADGRVNLSVIDPGPVRVSVPLFGYSLLVTGTAETVRVAILTIPVLPDSIP